MKKTLAILLALIMATSVAVTACESEGTGSTESQNFEMDFGEDTSSEVVTDENGNEVISTGENGTNKDTPGGSSSTMQPVSGLAYVLYPVMIRETAETSGKTVTKVEFGARLERIEANKKWTKVTYEGKTGYIMNDVITTQEETITFEDKGVAGEGENAEVVYPTAKVVVSGADNVKLRYTPLADGFPNDFAILKSEDLDLIGQIEKGTEVTVLAVSKDGMWAKVTSTKVDVPDNSGTYPKTYSSTKEGYIPCTYLAMDSNQNSSSNNGPAPL